MKALALVLKAQRVAGRRSGAWEQQVEQQTRSLGRGRGAARRQPRGSAPPRAHITGLARQADTSARLRQRCGWKVLVTHARPHRLSWEEAV